MTGADIAYHFQIKNSDSRLVFAEGEVIGFYTDKASGQTKIMKLTMGSAEETFLHGVVTRSQYIEAQRLHSTDGKKLVLLCRFIVEFMYVS